MLDNSQWLEVGAMDLDTNDDYESIQISAIDVDQLLPEARDRIQEKAMLDEKYMQLCKQVSTGGNIDKSFSISNELLCWKNRISVPEGLRQQVIQSEHDSKVAGHFGSERTMEILSKNFY